MNGESIDLYGVKLHVQNIDSIKMDVVISPTDFGLSR